MKTIWVCTLAACLAGTGTTFAQDALIKKKARTVSQQGATRGLDPSEAAKQRGGTPGAPGTAATAHSAQSESAQQQSVRKLVTDLAIVKSRSEVTPDLTQRLSNDLQACAEGVNKPSPDSINKLAGNLANSLHGKKLSAQDQATLAQDIATILNSATVAPAAAQSALRSTQSILKSSGVAEAEAQAIAADLVAIVNDAQKNVKAPAK